MTKRIITAETVRLAWKAGQSAVVYAEGDIVTQQAQDDARRYGLSLTPEDSVVPEAASVPAATPAPAVQESVGQPAQQHVTTPALSAEQLAAATRQLQEVLAPLTQALTAHAPAPAVPPVVFTPGVNPMAEPAPARPQADEALIAAIRGRVMAALPAGSGVDVAFVDRLIKSVLAETDDASPVQAEARPGIRQAGGVTHVDSRAQRRASVPVKGSVAVMDVLSPARGDAAAVGFLEWENLSFSWTFRCTEVLVVLEGELNLSIEGTTFSAAHGDVFSIPAGTEAVLSASGHVRCTTVAVATEPRS